MQLLQIPGFRRYRITEDGLSILNAATLKPLRLQTGKRGERRVSLTKDDGKTTCVTVDRLYSLARGKSSCLPADAVSVPGYKGYFVTPAGEVWSMFDDSLGTVKQLTLQENTHGYAYIMAYGKTPVSVHKLMLLAFVGPRPSPYHEVRHLNGVRMDNRRTNLAWGTKRENACDKQDHGTTIRGADLWSAVLDEDKVREMRRLHEVEGMDFSALGLKFGVNKVTARRVCRRLSWKHVV